MANRIRAFVAAFLYLIAMALPMPLCLPFERLAARVQRSET